MAAPRAEKLYEKWAWIIFFAVGAIFLVVNVVYLLFISEPLTDSDRLQTLTGMTWSQLVASSPSLANFITLGAKEFSLTAAVFAFFVVVISLKGYRRGEKWAWYALWILPVYRAVDATLIFSSTRLVEYDTFPLLIVFLLGLFLPYRKFFPWKRAPSA